MKTSKIILSLVITLLLMSLNYSVLLADDIRIRFNEEYININPSPIIIDGRTLVPARAISEMLGASVEWYEEARQVSLRMGSIRSALIIDSNIAVVNGHNIRLDVPAKIINGSTFIPLRFASENFGFEIDFIDGVILISNNIDIINKTIHPFAIALREYFYDFLEVFEGGQNTHAVFLENIDGNGTKGVFAMRFEQNKDEISPFSRIFYFYNGNLFYKDTGYQEGLSRIFIAVEHRYESTSYQKFAPIPIRPVNVVRNSELHSISVFTINNDKLVYDFTVIRLSNPQSEDTFYYIPGGILKQLNREEVIFENWDIRNSISEEEFLAITYDFGLQSLGNPWYQMRDDTEQILSMKFINEYN